MHELRSVLSALFVGVGSINCNLFPVVDVWGRKCYEQGATLIRCGILPQNLTSDFLKRMPMEAVVIFIYANWGYADRSFYPSDNPETARFISTAEAWLDFGKRNFKKLNALWSERELKEVCENLRSQFNFYAVEKWEYLESGPICTCKDGLETASISFHLRGCPAKKMNLTNHGGQT